MIWFEQKCCCHLQREKKERGPGQELRAAMPGRQDSACTRAVTAQW